MKREIKFEVFYVAVRKQKAQKGKKDFTNCMGDIKNYAAAAAAAPALCFVENMI